MCFWDDMVIRANTSQSITYTIDGKKPDRVIKFTFNLSNLGSPTLYYRFETIFYEKKPGFVQCDYLYMSEGGRLATIGVQSKLLNI